MDPRNIVVGVDGSAHAERAAAWAAEQASLEQRPLVVVSVGDGASALADGVVELVGQTHPSVAVRALSAPGDPRAVLLDLSRKSELVVVGSRGRGTLKTMLLGSVSVAVSAHADCPVVVCRPGTGDPRRGVVVGADGTSDSRPVLEFAYHQAALRAQPLTVLHGFWDAAVAVAQHREAAGKSVVQPDLEELRALLSMSVAGLTEDYPEVPVTFELRHGFVDEALSAHGSNWDLVVVGRHHMTSVSRLVMGSVSMSVLERARSTVAVVPEGLST